MTPLEAVFSIIKKFNEVHRPFKNKSQSEFDLNLRQHTLFQLGILTVYLLEIL